MACSRVKDNFAEKYCYSCYNKRNNTKKKQIKTLAEPKKNGLNHLNSHTSYFNFIFTYLFIDFWCTPIFFELTFIPVQAVGSRGITFSSTRTVALTGPIYYFHVFLLISFSNYDIFYFTFYSSDIEPYKAVRRAFLSSIVFGLLHAT